MNNAQLLLAAAAVVLPSLTVLLGIILQRQDTRDLRADMSTGFKDMRAEMIGLRKEVHADLLLIHERVAVVESRQTP